jgi:predicted N-acetyltransferase YhbS
MRAADLDAAWRAILDGGWGDRRTSLQFFLRLAPAEVFVAETDAGAIVGTATAVAYGQTGWIGLVFVAPAWRGRGLGRVLTEAAQHHLQTLGCQSLLLAATPLGLPIYTRLGFAEAGGYTVLTGHVSGPPAAPTGGHLHDSVTVASSVRSLTPDDLSAVAGVDRAATGEERRATLEAYVAEGAHGWVIGSPEGIRGFALRTPGGFGPVVASAPEDAQQLLTALLSESEPSRSISLIVPTENLAARAYLQSRGLEEQRHLPRMLLGQPVDWQPQALWAIISFALG